MGERNGNAHELNHAIFAKVANRCPHLARNIATTYISLYHRSLFPLLYDNTNGHNVTPEYFVDYAIYNPHLIIDVVKTNGLSRIQQTELINVLNTISKWFTK
jgi:hypothetical protein